jgi:cephalosporin-C deacetylase-like acetyl esterase
MLATLSHMTIRILALGILTLLTWLPRFAMAQRFEALRALYQYDPSVPLNVKYKEEADRATYKLYSIEYANPNGLSIHGLLVVPKKRGRKPAVVWMHSNGMLAWLGDAVLLGKAGTVSLIVDPPGGPSPQNAEQSRTEMIQTVIALRRAVDVLTGRDDIDPKRIGFVGHSYGAMMGAVATSVDNRFRAAVYEVGLLGMSIHIATSPHPWAQEFRKELGARLQSYLQTIEAVDAKNYIGHAPPIQKLFQSAYFDPGVPRRDAEDFYKAASEPKTMKWYDTGHDIDDISAIADRARFLGKVLNIPGTEQVLIRELRQ